MQQPTHDLVAVTDPAAVDRQFRGPFVAAIVCTAVGAIALVVVLGLLIDHVVRGWTLLFVVPSSLLAVAVLTCCVVTVVVVRRRWRATRAMRERVQVDANGIAVWLPTGRVAHAPWHAIGSARRVGDGRWGRMTLRVDPRLVGGSVSDVDRHRIAARGIVLDAAGMQPELAVVAHAIAVRTQGRVVA